MSSTFCDSSIQLPSLDSFFATISVAVSTSSSVLNSCTCVSEGSVLLLSHAGESWKARRKAGEGDDNFLGLTVLEVDVGEKAVAAMKRKGSSNKLRDFIMIMACSDSLEGEQSKAKR